MAHPATEWRLINKMKTSLFALLLMIAPAALAQANCTNQIGAGGTFLVGSTTHFTQVTGPPACVQVGPAGTAVSGAVHTSVVADATGWNITANTVGTDTLTFTPSNTNNAPVSYNFTVTAVTTVLTSP